MYFNQLLDILQHLTDHYTGLQFNQVFYDKKSFVVTLQATGLLRLLDSIVANLHIYATVSWLVDNNVKLTCK